MRVINRPHVDIVVPVFNARGDVQQCVESVLRHATGSYSLVIVDDRSTDLELVAYLDRLAAHEKNVILLRPEKNGGFVQSANMGMKYAVQQGHVNGLPRDVLLLNSDTIVSAEFLERLQDCAYADAQTGIVSPFSNNATICSIPKFCQDNELPTDRSLEDYARIIAQASLKRRPELVTAVGFCFYIRATVLKSIGFFDPVYGRGFGEENEYCEKAKQAGFTIRLADDVFVAHTGKASFGAEGRMLEHQNMKVLLARFPHYMDDVAEFCETNPLLEVQTRANFFSARAASERFPALLHLIHSSPFSAQPGGSEHYVVDLVREMRAPRAIVAYPIENRIEAREIFYGKIEEGLTYTFPLSQSAPKIAYDHEPTTAVLESMVDAFGVTLAHVHHYFGWPLDLWKVFERKQVPYVAMLHDFFLVCPSHNLFNFAEMRPCKCDGSESETKECLAAYSAVAHTPVAMPYVESRRLHRAAGDELLKHAMQVIAPSRKVVELVSERTSVPIATQVIPHGYDQPGEESITRRFRTPCRLRIAVLGNVNYPNKGAGHYLEVVRGTKLADVEWHFFGDLRAFDYEQQLAAAGDRSKLVFHGAYSRDDIIKHLHESGIGLVVILPACHETFSYTLSEALISGTPVIALAMGSLTERLKDLSLEECLCSSTSRVIEKILFYASCADELTRVANTLRSFRHRTVAETVREVCRSYGDVGQGLFRERTESITSRNESAFDFYFNSRREGINHLAPIISADRYRPNWWTPIVKRLGTITQRADGAIRNHYFRQRVRVVKSFPFQQIARLCALSPDTEILKERAKIVSFRAKGKDPFLVFPESRVDTNSVDCLRLRIRCVTERRAKAQLFWTHEPTEGFSEAKSCRIPLKRTSKWQDVLVDLRGWDDRSRWTADSEICALRLDPLDCEGYFELQDLSFVQLETK